LGVNRNLSPLGKTALSKVREIPLSNDTMARRVDRIAEDLEDQPVACRGSWMPRAKEVLGCPHVKKSFPTQFISKNF